MRNSIFCSSKKNMFQFIVFPFLLLISEWSTETNAQTISSHSVTSNLVSVKIIEEPATFLANINLQNFENSHTLNIDARNKLEPSLIKPSNFSGPPQLEDLNGQCFEKIHKKFLTEIYIFFSNLLETFHSKSLYKF